MRNADIATEAIAILDLACAVINNIGANESGKIKVHTDCKIVSDMLISDRIKASQLALDGSGTISKIM